ncbi:MAG TPA: DUF1289 domain-containing protein [Alphaproteobacteria bacterium]|nr:DUF1289 domain-containing protein [Alphaproteobacteria bacterium]
MTISAQRQSPCIQVCQMNQQTGFCAGCFRSQEEIARWLRYTNEERDAVLGKLGQRRADFYANGGEFNFSPFDYE